MNELKILLVCPLGMSTEKWSRERERNDASR